MEWTYPVPKVLDGYSINLYNTFVRFETTTKHFKNIMKPELIFVSPKTSEAKEVFQYDMDRLHTCKIVERKDGMMKLSSISGRFVFWMNENDEDRNWKSLNK